MICKPCRDRDHKRCDGITKDRTYCDCAHKPPIVTSGFKDQVERFISANDELLRIL